MVNGLYRLTASSSGSPVQATTTPRTPAFLASSSGTGSNMPCQAGLVSAAAYAAYSMAATAEIWPGT